MLFSSLLSIYAKKFALGIAIFSISGIFCSIFSVYILWAGRQTNPAISQSEKQNKKADTPQNRDRQPALPPNLAPSQTWELSSISFNAGLRCISTFAAPLFAPALQSIHTKLRGRFSRPRTWKVSPNLSSLRCRLTLTFPLHRLFSLWLI